MHMVLLQSRLREAPSFNLLTVSCECQRFAVALHSATMLSLMQQGNFHRTTKKKRYRICRSQGNLLELIFHRIIELSGQNFVYHGGKERL